MKMSRFAKVALAFGVVSACLFGLAACSSSGAEGGVAATVNGTEISEQKITDQIELLRSQSGLDDEDQWGQFLAQQDETPSSIRDEIIDTLVEQELIVQGAKDLGLTVEDSEVDGYVDQMKSNYDDDEAWNNALEEVGFTEESYRKAIEDSLYEQKVNDYFKENAEVTDEDYITSAQTYASQYDGAKRSSHILFKVEDTSDEAAMAEATSRAEAVLAQINSGADFAEIAKENSEDTSAEDGGDVGWDALNSFVTEYTDALDALELDQVSGLVTSDYGIHIIKCTDVFNAPEEITSLDQIPEAFQDNIKEMATSVKANEDYEAWLQELKDNADIVKNDMPAGLSYDVDMSKYTDESDDEGDSSDDEADADEDADSDETITIDADDLDENGEIELTGDDEADADEDAEGEGNAQ